MSQACALEEELAMFWRQDGVAAFFPLAPGRRRIIADAGTGFSASPTRSTLSPTGCPKGLESIIRYPGSPLNAGSAHGLGAPGPGQRMIDSRPFGAGDRPRFALMAADGEDARAIVRDFAPLLEAEVCPPPNAAGLRLVRPDGYVAAAARAGEWGVIRGRLGRIGNGRNRVAGA